jgi:hypothetical protein
VSAWGCPHELEDKCVRVNNLRCDPGMKGCVLFGRFVWADESKNRPAKPERGNGPSPDEDDKRVRPSEDD